MKVEEKWIIIFIILTIITLNLIILINYYKYPVFSGPDETINYYYSIKFIENQDFKIPNQLSTFDKYNHYHMRSEININGYSVPVSFLGPIYYYSIFNVYLNKFTIFLGLLFSFIILFFIYKITKELNQDSFIFIIFLIIPLFYYFGHTFMNILPAISFLISGTYFLLKFYNNQNNLSNLIISTFLLSISVFMRYEFIIYNLLIILSLTIYYWDIFLKNKFKIILSFFIIFLITLTPILILHNNTYGNPFITGTHIFYSEIFPDRISDNISGFKYDLFFGGLTDINQLTFNIFKYTYNFLPILFLFSFLGILIVLKEKRYLIAFLLLISLLFIFQFQGTSDVWGSSTIDGSINKIDTSLDHSMIRYWLINYIAAGFISIYFFDKKIRYNSKILLIIYIFLIITIFNINLYSTSEVNNISQIILNEDRYFSFSSSLNNIPNNSIIFCSRNDKYIIHYRTVATWWNGKEKYNSSEIAESIFLIKNYSNRPVYLYDEEEVDINDINSNLRMYNLSTNPVLNTKFHQII